MLFYNNHSYVLFYMIKYVRIKNFALIDDLTISFESGLSVITGETGSGKSIILDALLVALGKRVEPQYIIDKGNNSLVEILFYNVGYRVKKLLGSVNYFNNEDTILLKRDIFPNGKSKFFINNIVISSTLVKSLALYLIDVYRQNDNILVNKPTFSLDLIDACLGNYDLFNKYFDAYHCYSTYKRDYDALVSSYEKSITKLSNSKVLFDELEECAFGVNEQQTLEDELKALENVGAIKVAISSCLNFLENNDHSVLSKLNETLNSLGSIKDIMHNYGDLYDRLNSCVIELGDIASTLNSEYSYIDDYDINRLNYVRQRLSTIYSLLNKHDVNNLQDLLLKHNSLKKELETFLDMEAEVENGKKVIDSLESAMLDAAHMLSDARINGLSSIKESIQGCLEELSLQNARIEFKHYIVKPNDYGIDNIDIFFSANKGVEVQPFSKVASGGEFARLMLSFKLAIANNFESLTMVFDEIDTGVSGEVGIKMADMICSIALKHQVIVITHLPNIASRGENHYFVYKEVSNQTTFSKVKKLTKEGRIIEIAKMIGGNNPSSSTKAIAAEMLNY